MSLHDEAIVILEKLVAFPTVSADSNMKLIHWIEGYLKDHGVASTLFANDEGTKANLFATIGDASKSGIVLSGHTDVVPVKGQNWTSEPFTMTERDNKLYGRGTCDMKGFIALALASVPHMVKRGMSEPLHLAFSYDEEVGCTGVTSMVDYIATMAPRPRLCIVGEPTSMKVINAHKGIRSHTVTFIGQEAHSSAPHLGANAIVAAARFVDEIVKLAEKAREHGPYDHRFIPPHTTFNVGEISGGTAINIIPNRAEVSFELRAIPGFETDEVISHLEQLCDNEILPKMRETAPKADIHWHQVSNVPPLMNAEVDAAEVFVMRLAEANDVGTVAYATEAGLFQSQAEIPTVVCGPGSIDQAHAADEFIALEQVRLGARFMGRLMDVVCR